MSGLISVVINNFNYGRFLGQAIQSVLDQDYPSQSVELIIVDDGSTDNSKEVIEGFKGRVRAIFQSNQGQAAALNAGFAAARGEIVCLLDSDDWWRKDKLSRVADAFEQDPSLGMVQHWTLEVDNAGTPLSTALPAIPKVYRLEDFLQKDLFFTGTTGLSFRRKIIEKILPIPTELRIRADGYLYYSIFLAPVGNIAEPLGLRRIHGGNRYANRYRDAARLQEHLKAIVVLNGELQKFLDERNLTLSGGMVQQAQIEEVLTQFFLARYRWHLGSAFRYWMDIGRLIPSRAYALFKQGTLLLVFLSPRLYLLFHSMYSKLPFLVSARFKFLKD